MFCFAFLCGKKNPVSSLVSVASLSSTSTLSSTETSVSGGKSAMKTRPGAKTRGVRNRKKKGSPLASTKSWKTSAVAPRTASMKLLAGSSPRKTANTTKKTTTGCTENSADSKKPSSKPTPQPEPKHLEEARAEAQTSSAGIGATPESGGSATPRRPINKTAAKKDVTSQPPETTKVGARSSSRVPGAKCIQVKEAEEASKFPSSFGSVAESAAQEVEENSTQTSPHSWKNLEQFNQKLMELNFSYDGRNSTRDSNPFSYNKTRPLGKSRSTTRASFDEKSPVPAPYERKSLASPPYERKSLASPPYERKSLASPPYERKSLASPPYARKSPVPAPHDGKSPVRPPFDGRSLFPPLFEGNTNSSISADENRMTPALESVPDNPALPGGLPNLGNSCYINASLQVLLSAKAFCDELFRLLDVSSRTMDDTFFRCFAELSRLRNGCVVRGDFDKRSLLLALISSATATKREFTIYEQNDAHEFLCHCLTHMERSGHGQGWLKHVHPRCPVKTNFKFRMRNVITCCSCGAQQNKVDVFNHVSVPLVYSSVDQCLYDLVNEATEVESKCNICGGEFAKSRWTFQTSPRFLILQLNRFRLGEQHTVIKVDTSVEIQPELQIDCLPQSDTTASHSSTAETNELAGPTSSYRLISVLSHFGSSAEYGHYVSDCFNHHSHEWMTYDDDQVTPTTQTDVLRRRSSNAYVLLYERLDTG